MFPARGRLANDCPTLAAFRSVRTRPRGLAVNTWVESFNHPDSVRRHLKATPGFVGLRSSCAPPRCDDAMSRYGLFRPVFLPDDSFHTYGGVFPSLSCSAYQGNLSRAGRPRPDPR